MALGGTTGDKLVSLQTEIWVHMTWASSCPPQSSPAAAAHAAERECPLCTRSTHVQAVIYTKCFLFLFPSLSLSVRHIQYRENKKACARPSWAERCVLRTLMCNTIESSHEYQMLICSFAKFLLRLQRMLFKQSHGIWTKKKTSTLHNILHSNQFHMAENLECIHFTSSLQLTVLRQDHLQTCAHSHKGSTSLNET